MRFETISYLTIRLKVFDKVFTNSSRLVVLKFYFHSTIGASSPASLPYRPPPTPAFSTFYSFSRISNQNIGTTAVYISFVLAYVYVSKLNSGSQIPESFVSVNFLILPC